MVVREMVEKSIDMKVEATIVEDSTIIKDLTNKNEMLLL